MITADAEVAESAGASVTVVGQRLPDLVRLVEDQLLATKFPLQLTRPTVCAIIAAVPPNLQARAIDDPSRWARIVATAIRSVTIEEMVKHIAYEPDPEADWWDAEVVFLEAEERDLPPARDGAMVERGVVAAPVGGLNLYDHVVHDSGGERDFATQLENASDHVRLFTKLPRRFKVRTPVGEYSPDWAIVYDDEGATRLYLIRETKGTTNLADLDWDEQMRIRFARHHFAAAPNGTVDYSFTTAEAGLRVTTDWEASTP